MADPDADLDTALADPDADLDTAVRAACTDAGFEVTRIEPLRSGLSLRRFARVHTRSARDPSLVARVEAPEDPAGRPAAAAPEPPLEPIRALLESHGLPVPRRLGGDAQRGVELLEDLGGQDLASAAREADPETRRALYREACSLLPRLQRIGPEPGVAAFERQLDAALLDYKAGLFADDALPARGRPTREAERDCVREAFARIAEGLARAPQRLAHRDYQSANLLVRSAGAKPSLGWIDFQGAFLAPPEYDLVCLLRDSYVELPPEEVEALAEAVRPELPDAPGREDFWRRFDWLTLTRKGKDYARFVHAAHRRGEGRFLAHLPTTARHLHRAARTAAARDPWLAPLAELVLALPETPCAP